MRISLPFHCCGHFSPISMRWSFQFPFNSTPISVPFHCYGHFSSFYCYSHFSYNPLSHPFIVMVTSVALQCCGHFSSFLLLWSFQLPLHAMAISIPIHYQSYFNSIPLSRSFEFHFAIMAKGSRHEHCSEIIKPTSTCNFSYLFSF